jgi:biopolymer transport protein ExbB/TolQ
MFILIILGIVLAILWIILPFAVFGINKRLDRVIWESEKLNTKMQTFIDLLTKRKQAQKEQQNASTNKTKKHNE